MPSPSQGLPLQRLELHVLPADGVRTVAFFDAMDLEADITFRVTGLGEVSGFHSVDVALIMVSLDDDPVVVPLALFKSGFGFVSADGFGLGQNAPSGATAGLVIKITGGAVYSDLTLGAEKATRREWLTAFAAFWRRVALLGQMTAHLDA